jgi:GNAT superfamily N-acetyltransferase
MSTTGSSPARLIGDVFALVYRAAPGYEAHLWPDATLALSGDTGAYWLNTAVIGDGPNPEARLRDAIATFSQRALPGWIMHDDALTDRLASLAREAGFDDGGTVPFMVYQAASVNAVPAGDLAVERVGDERGLREANRITAAAFETPLDAVDRVWGPLLLEMPGFDLFLGRREGMAICVVMTVRHGATVGIWTMGTLPNHQRGGAGRQLLQTVLRQHRDQGAESFYLAAFEAGKRLYEQTGFRRTADIRLWVVPDGVRD